MFIAVTTRPEWLGVPMPERLRPLCEYSAPIRETRGEHASLRRYAAAFYAARVIDRCIGAEQDHRAWERAIPARCKRRVSAVVLFLASANKDDCCNMRNNCCRT
ncbi:darcynin family protein [Burkholderia sp. BCC0322]|uniref:darcynin family protein n=1 Tax=unclassified Burkholderia TaxID=2613784 RepID=UPI00158E5B69|nr:darcynin family protein [Burkholderia sp. BCC0322]